MDSGALLILRPKNLPGIEHEVMLDILAGGEVAVAWLHADDMCPFDPASVSWRAALGDAVELHQGLSNSINLVMGDQSVATWMHDAKGTTVVCRKRAIWRAVLKQLLSLWDHLLPVPADREVRPVAGADTRFRSRSDRMDLDIRSVCERLVAQFGLRVIGEDIPELAVDDHDLKVNSSILNHLGRMYLVDINLGFWRQLREAVQFTLGVGPCPGTTSGWMFRWRVSDHHLPATLNDDDPEIADTGFMILGMEHVDHLEEMIAATLAPYGVLVNLRRPPTTSSPASPRPTTPQAGDWLPAQSADLRDVVEATPDQTTDLAATGLQHPGADLVQLKQALAGAKLEVDPEPNEFCLSKVIMTTPDGKTFTGVTCTRENFDRAVV